METSMDLASSAQLEMTDKLRELGISDYVALPQVNTNLLSYQLKADTVVACCSRGSIEVIPLSACNIYADLCSGKSSVLESFSELPFPRDSGLCTRFATKITFRRATRSSTKVSIIPGPDRSREQATKLRAFIREFEHLTGDVFLEILRDVRFMLQYDRFAQLIVTPTGLQRDGHSRAGPSIEYLSIYLQR